MNVISDIIDAKPFSAFQGVEIVLSSFIPFRSVGANVVHNRIDEHGLSLYCNLVKSNRYTPDLSSCHVPVRFIFPPSPPPPGVGSIRFPFGMRFEALHSAAWRKG